MIDMWNWLLDCYNAGCLTLEEMENILKDDEAAEQLWREFSSNTNDFVDEVRDQVKHFISHVKNWKAKGKA